MTQLELPPTPTPKPGTLKDRVYQALLRGGWMTDAEIARAVGHRGYMSSVESARRVLRQQPFCMDIASRKRSANTSEYRLVR